MSRVLGIFLCGALLVGWGPATAQASMVGRPSSLDITIKQGATTLVNAAHVVFDFGKPLDGTDYIEIADIGGGNTRIYLSVVMQDPTAEESLITFCIRAADPTNPNLPAPLGLFDQSGSGKIDVSINNLYFKVGSLLSNVNLVEFASPLGNGFAAMYMFDQNGWYFDLPSSNTFWIGANRTEQVPYSIFKDGNTSEYNFLDSWGTMNVNVGWYNMYSPVDATYELFQSYNPYGVKWDGGPGNRGKVFEMGLCAYAIGNYVPEPATLGLFLIGAIGLLRRR